MSGSERIGHVEYELRGEIAMVCLSRPEKRNAISEQLVEDLAVAVERARAEARAAVLHGAGDHFSAGLDLQEYSQKDPLQSVLMSQRWHEVFDRVEFGPIPWIAALHGAVVGGGLELAACTHIRVADETAFFGLPEGQRGIFVGGGGSVRISRILGVPRMMDMMLTGRTVGGDEAEAWGVAQYLVPAGDAFGKALDLAQAIVGNSALSNHFILNALPRIAEASRSDGLFMESVVAAFVASSPEAEDRLRGFLEKRTAKVVAPAKDAR